MNFKELRESIGSVIETKKITGIPRTTMYNYENYVQFPQLENLKKIQKYFNLTDEEVAELFLDYYKHVKNSKKEV